MPTDQQVQAIAELVEKFESERNLQQSEADVRAGYIDLLFYALGWNIYNDPGQPTNYRREGYVRGAGYVDVGLEIRGQAVLFLEAKRFGRIPASSERTGDRTTEEKQAFRYARGKKISYAILTNFERLHVFNADHERLILAFDHPRQYLDRLEDLWRLSPEQVEGGSLPWWEGQLEKKDIDLQFLAALRRWRLLLANAIYQDNGDNPALQTDGAFDFDALMAAVQRILDRLILVRYGDDKEVLLAHDLLDTMLVEYRNRGAYARPDHLMRAFIDLSHMMDEHHNTTLFAPGHVCERVSVPNQVLAEVISEMNAISFRKFTSDILGSTYESYLGTKLTLCNGAIQDEERRDVRKGRGIYYTPRWVVEYIVDNSLGRRLQEIEKQHGLHAIEKVRGLAVLDPACGSGSFLIYAYQVLADFYRRLNQAIAQQQARLLAQAAQFRLFETLQEIQHLPQPVPDYPQVILKEHLYGVDLDPEAAEIAAVNLTMQAFADSRREKLPLILNENIKVGNSLISGSEAELRPYFGDAWHDKRPFDWQQEFRDIRARGGFDIVIGNPPYVGFHGFEEDKPYLRENYATARSRFDLYIPFVERAYQLLKPGGLFGFICPTNFMKRAHGQALRDFLLTHTTILSVHDFQDQQAFEGPLNYTGVLVFRKSAPRSVHTLRYSSGDLGGQFFEYSQAKLGPDTWVFRDPETETLVHKALKVPTVGLGEITQAIAEGIVTGKNEVFLLTQDDVAQHNIEDAIIRKAVRGRHIKRYVVSWDGTCVIYPYRSVGGKTEPIPEDDLAARFPNAYRYLVASRPDLGGRGYFERSPKLWYELWCQRDMRHQAAPKLLTPELADANKFAPCPNEVFYLDTACGITLREDVDESPLFLLGLLNSTWANYYYRSTTVPKANGFLIYKTMYLRKFPVRRIDFGTGRERTVHHEVVALVQRMLDLHQRLAAKGDMRDQEREQIEREIAGTDREIDDLIYDLYGLTAAERALVEAEIKR